MPCAFGRLNNAEDFKSRSDGPQEKHRRSRREFLCALALLTIMLGVLMVSLNGSPRVLNIGITINNASSRAYLSNVVRTFYFRRANTSQVDCYFLWQIVTLAREASVDDNMYAGKAALLQSLSKYAGNYVAVVFSCKWFFSDC